MPIFILAHFSQHECLNNVKRIKKRLIEEFETLDIFEGKPLQFKYGTLYIRLMWTTRGRWISLKEDDSGRTTIKDYTTLPTTPVPILIASIKFFKSRIKDEEKKKLRKEQMLLG